MRDRKLIKVISAILAGGMIMLGLFGCEAKKYKVDYDGDREFYEGAKDEYAAGEKVVLYYDLIATDTDYAFYLDDERINFGYSEDRGFIIEFTMPEHDVKLRCETRNSMEYIPPIDPGTLLVDYFEETVATDGGDDSFEMTLTYYDPVQVKLDVYGDKDEPDSYLVPYEAFDVCLGIMYSEGLESWESMGDTVSLDGVRKVMKFRGEYKTISKCRRTGCPRTEKELSTGYARLFRDISKTNTGSAVEIPQNKKQPEGCFLFSVFILRGA